MVYRVHPILYNPGEEVWFAGAQTGNFLPVTGVEFNATGSPGGWLRSKLHIKARTKAPFPHCPATATPSLGNGEKKVVIGRTECSKERDPPPGEPVASKKSRVGRVQRVPPLKRGDGGTRCTRPTLRLPGKPVVSKFQSLHPILEFKRVKTSFILTAILTSICLGGLAMSTAIGSEDAGQRREKAHKAFHDGNFRDAYDALRGLLLDKTVVPAGNDLNEAVASLQRLNRTSEIDELLEAAVKTHAGRPGPLVVPLGRGQSVSSDSPAGVHRGRQVLSRAASRRRRPAGQYARSRPRPRLATDGPGPARRPQGQRPCQGGRLSPGDGRHVDDRPLWAGRIVAVAGQDRSGGPARL